MELIAIDEVVGFVLMAGVLVHGAGGGDFSGGFFANEDDDFGGVFVAIEEILDGTERGGGAVIGGGGGVVGLADEVDAIGFGFFVPVFDIDVDDEEVVGVDGAEGKEVVVDALGGEFGIAGIEGG